MEGMLFVFYSHAWFVTDIIAAQQKCKQAKVESNQAQASLEKEITSLRETNRMLQLRLRDMEVANDDFERQARHTTSSLEDLESKYNMCIERDVMLEEEVRVGELEREGLRIEVQRLRDELSDLWIEAEVMQARLRRAEDIAGERKPSQPSKKPHRQESTDFQKSGPSEPSPTTPIPPPSKSDMATITSSHTPLSPPLSDVRTRSKPPSETFSQQGSDAPTQESIVIQRPNPRTYVPKGARQSREPSRPSLNAFTETKQESSTLCRESLVPPDAEMFTLNVSRSGSLSHIRGLLGKMQKLEERVQSARSKLPAPTNTPPKASPRGCSSLKQAPFQNVTVRSSRKRPSNVVDWTVPVDQDEDRPKLLAFHTDRVSGTELASPREQPVHRPSSRAATRQPSSRRESVDPRSTSNLGLRDDLKAEETVANRSVIRPSAGSPSSAYRPNIRTAMGPPATRIESTHRQSTSRLGLRDESRPEGHLEGRPVSRESNSSRSSGQSVGRQNHIANQMIHQEVHRTSNPEPRRPRPSMATRGTAESNRRESTAATNERSLHSSVAARNATVTSRRESNGKYQPSHASSTPANRRTTMDRSLPGGMKTPSSGLPRRQSGGGALSPNVPTPVTVRRLSHRPSKINGITGPAERKRERQLSEVGETY